MAHHDDDLIPEPDAEPTPAEKARARSFAELVDKVVAGRPPAAMSAEDRDLIEVATVIRAAHDRLELADARRASLVEQALHRAIDRGGRTTVPPMKSAAVEPASPAAPIPIESARRWRRRAPWIVSGVSMAVAAAAVLVLLLRPAPRPEMPAELRSRPSDPLIGEIPPERAGDAVSRIDTIFADRLDGYRQLSLGRGGRP
jgi:hypothetical protein